MEFQDPEIRQSEETLFKIQALLDGELSPEDAKSAAALIAKDPEAAAIAAELGFVKTAMASNEAERALPESADFHWSKIRAAIEREERAAAKSEARSAGGFGAWLAGMRRRVVAFSGLAAAVVVTLISMQHAGVTTGFLEEIEEDALDSHNSLSFKVESEGMTVVWLIDRSEAEKPGADDMEWQ